MFKFNNTLLKSKIFNFSKLALLFVGLILSFLIHDFYIIFCNITELIYSYIYNPNIIFNMSDTGSTSATTTTIIHSNDGWAQGVSFKDLCSIDILPDSVINWLKEFKTIVETPESIKAFKDLYYSHVLLYSFILIFIILVAAGTLGAAAIKAAPSLPLMQRAGVVGGAVVMGGVGATVGPEDFPNNSALEGAESVDYSLLYTLIRSDFILTLLISVLILSFIVLIFNKYVLKYNLDILSKFFSKRNKRLSEWLQNKDIQNKSHLYNNRFFFILFIINTLLLVYMLALKLYIGSLLVLHLDDYIEDHINISKSVILLIGLKPRLLLIKRNLSLRHSSAKDISTVPLANSEQNTTPSNLDIYSLKDNSIIQSYFNSSPTYIQLLTIILFNNHLTPLEKQLQIESTLQNDLKNSPTYLSKQIFKNLILKMSNTSIIAVLFTNIIPHCIMYGGVVAPLIVGGTIIVTGATGSTFDLNLVDTAAYVNSNNINDIGPRMDLSIGWLLFLIKPGNLWKISLIVFIFSFIFLKLVGIHGFSNAVMSGSVYYLTTFSSVLILIKLIYEILNIIIVQQHINARRAGVKLSLDMYPKFIQKWFNNLIIYSESKEEINSFRKYTYREIGIYLALLGWSILILFLSFYLSV